jgi:hypothetical protein
MRNQSQTPTEPEGDARGLYEQLRVELVGGLLYCHDRANTNTGKNLEVMAFAYALIELLLDKGVLTEAELNERKRQVAFSADYFHDGQRVLVNRASTARSPLTLIR